MVKNKKKIYKVLLLAGIFLILGLAYSFFSNYFVNIRLEAVEIPDKHRKLLVVAPHPDDEALGAAELMKKSLEKGAEVRVVVVTNGDGYTEAVDIDERKVFPKPKDYIDFAYERQAETLAAMEYIGLKEDMIYFLGYPDGGLSHLLKENFNKPYTSKYTKRDFSPYPNSYRREAPYTGESLLEDLSSVIAAYKPDYIVYPQAADYHPDHRAVSSFVSEALEKSGYKPKEYLYLIHQGDWPVPRMLDKKRYLVPPDKLEDSGLSWSTLDMTKEETDEKEKIIRIYKSQFPVLENLMLAFARKNELFAYDAHEFVKN